MGGGSFQRQGTGGDGWEILFVRLQANTVLWGVFEAAAMALALLTRLNFRAYPRVRIASHEIVGQGLRTSARSGGLD